MSFKRDGDDKNLLGNLRKRRINELLGEDVPKDEALLLSNGRYTCLVCNHRPIFDTVYMLTIHRKSKKHAISEEYHRQQQKSLEDLIQKRKHEHYLVDGTTKIQQAKHARQGLGLGTPYDPRVKKQKPNDRKIRLDLMGKSDGSESEKSKEFITSFKGPGKARTHCVTTDNSGNWSVGHNEFLNKNEKAISSSSKQFKDFSKEETADFCQNDLNEETSLKGVEGTNTAFVKAGEVLLSHPKQLSKIFHKTSEFTGHIKPYKSRTNRIKLTESLNNTSLSSNNDTMDFTGNRQIEQNTNNINNSITNEELLSNCNLLQPPAPLLLTSTHCYTDVSRHDGNYLEKSNVNKIGNKHVKLSTKHICTNVNRNKKGPETNNHGTHLKGGKTSTDIVNKNSKAEQYLHYRGAGWKKDLTGKWIKDEDAEFDSDEEPPDLP